MKAHELITLRLRSTTEKETIMFVDDKWVGQFRHVLTTLGGVLVALGYFTGDDVASWLNGYDQVAGPAFVFVGQIWSWLVKT